ncbi:hypothetical protein APP_22350 [Aeribacillus pallidus]|nr:hypothetical protein APP_22350 [Aeribacillus pallidus]
MKTKSLSKLELFKQFIKKHPKLIEEVRKEKKTWKEIYEDWQLLGEEDPLWNKYRSNSMKSRKHQQGDFLKNILQTFQHLDVETVNKHLYKMNDAISTIQNLLKEIESSRKSDPNHSHPLSFRKD